MNPLIREALEITKELGAVTFIGAIAIYLHTNTGRRSQDLDFAVAPEIPRDTMIDKRYKIVNDKWYSPRGYRIDIYTRDIGEIPISIIIDTAREVKVDKKGSILRVANLEVMIVAKHRASRPQDIDDLRVIAKERYSDIDWRAIESLAKQPIEYQNIKTSIETLRNT